MKSEHITPFIESAISVFQTMLGCSAKLNGLEQLESYVVSYDITGVIGMSGSTSGDVVISFEKQVALSATEALLGGSYDTINDDVIDAVGELTNMIAGQAKAQISKSDMNLALPTVIVGRDHTIRFPSRIKPMSVPFESDWGAFNIEVGLVESL